MKEIEFRKGMSVIITDNEYRKEIALEKRFKRDRRKAKERYNKSLMVAMSTLFASIM